MAPYHPGPTLHHCTIPYSTAQYHTALHSTMLHYTVPYYTILRYTVPQCTILYHTDHANTIPQWTLPVLYRTTLHGSISYGTTLHGSMSYRTTLHGSMSYRTTLHGSMSYRTTPYRTVLYWAVLSSPGPAPCNTVSRPILHHPLLLPCVCPHTLLPRTLCGAPVRTSEPHARRVRWLSPSLLPRLRSPRGPRSYL